MGQCDCMSKQFVLLRSQCKNAVTCHLTVGVYLCTAIFLPAGRPPAARARVTRTAAQARPMLGSCGTLVLPGPRTWFYRCTGLARAVAGVQGHHPGPPVGSGGGAFGRYWLWTMGDSRPRYPAAPSTSLPILPTRCPYCMGTKRRLWSDASGEQLRCCGPEWVRSTRIGPGRRLVMAPAARSYYEAQGGRLFFAAHTTHTN